MHARVRFAMRSVQAVSWPPDAPGVRAVRAAPFPHTYRLRAGRHRILFAWLPDVRLLVFTTAFLKRRSGDYVRAMERHRKRMRV